MCFLCFPSLWSIRILLFRMVGGGAFQPYMPDKDSLQGWVGSVSSTRDGNVPGLHVAQEALLTPVCDTGYSHVLRGRLLQGTQPFDKGLGFSHQEAGQRAWEQEQRRGQVRLQRRPPAAPCAWRGNIFSMFSFFNDQPGRSSFSLIFFKKIINSLISLNDHQNRWLTTISHRTRAEWCVAQLNTSNEKLPINMI